MLRAMKATVSHDAGTAIPTAVRINRDVISIAAGMARNDPLQAIRCIIRFAKEHVPGPWVVDLPHRQAEELWVAIGFKMEQKLRAMRPVDAPPGWMFSVEGVDVCETWERAPLPGAPTDPPPEGE